MITCVASAGKAGEGVLRVAERGERRRNWVLFFTHVWYNPLWQSEPQGEHTHTYTVQTLNEVSVWWLNANTGVFVLWLSSTWINPSRYIRWNHCSRHRWAFSSVLHNQKSLKHYGPLSLQLAAALCTDCTPSLTLWGVSQTVLHALRVWWESSWPLCSHTLTGLSGWFKLLFVFQPSTGNASGKRKREAPKPQVSTSCTRTRIGYSYLVGILVPTKIWMHVHTNTHTNRCMCLLSL